MGSIKHFKLIWGIGGILLALVVYFLIPGDSYPKAPHMAAIITLMAVWWMTEVLPIPVTSLLPIVLMPMFDLADVATIGPYYGKPIIFLFLGGFLLALGLQESGVHKRIALTIVGKIGSKPGQLILGFMISTWLMSMWISNTASVMVMLPVALSVIDHLPIKNGIQKPLAFGTAFMLGIAYAADIGGMATPVGTPPNLIFMEIYGQTFPNMPAIGFTEWMAIGLPLSIVFLFLGWLILTKFIFKLPSHNMLESKNELRTSITALGKMRRDEKWSGGIFLLAVVLWMTGSDIQVHENLTIMGWRSLTGLKELTDPAIAVATATLLFIFPSKDRPGERLLSWEKGNQLPWGILLLFGGGFAIAAGFEMSGLSELVKSALSKLPQLPDIALVLIICLVVTFLTEITSNSAITTLLLPILAAMAVVFDIEPKWLMIPATLSASCAFMTPIASPTQAIVFGTNHISIQQMMRAGIWFNLLGIVLMGILFALIIP